MTEKAIVLEHIDKVYSVYSKGWEKYLDFLLPKPFGKRFYAIKDVSLSLEKGRSLGLLGLNGSGKTTLANIISGASAPTVGNMSVLGKVSMTSVSSGVVTAMTGRENIIQKCLLLGLDYAEIIDLMPEIIEFSELGDVIDQQVKTYSSGMRSKLGFAISINIDPDVLIIDEALSVGDPTFTQKCLAKMEFFRERGKTIVFVSHSMSQVKDFCDRAVWLEGGEIRSVGECGDVVGEYTSFIQWFNHLPADEQKAYKQQIREKQLGEKK